MLKRAISSTISLLFVPVALIAMAVVAVSQSATLPRHLSAVLLLYAPYAALGLGLILSWIFNRSRAFFLLLVLLLLCWLADYPFTSVQRHVFYDLVGVLLPLNLVFFVWTAERGVLTRYGVLRIIWIGLQVILAGWWLNQGGAVPQTWLSPDSLWTDVVNTSGLPPATFAAFLVAAVLLGTHLVMSRGALDAAFFAVLLVAAVLLREAGNIFAIKVYYTAAGLILVAGIVQDSYRIAYRDELTGLPGRRALREQMMKLGNRYTIAMLDVDFFKKFNDTYGHDVGDQVLRFVAAQMQRVAGGGKAYRYGGEEFTILFPGRGVVDVIPHLEQVRESIATTPFSLRSKDRPKKKPENIRGKGNAKQVTVTISIGVAEKKQRQESQDDVMKQADQALYRAKEGGRNRVSQ